MQAGLTADIFGQGVAVADYDGDGYEDIFITGFGKCVLYHNNGNGTFTDVTAASGIARHPVGEQRGLVPASDNDGKLDLFIDEFVDLFQPASPVRRPSPTVERLKAPRTSNRRTTANPKIFKPMPSQLYRNLGNGKICRRERQQRRNPGSQPEARKPGAR